MPKNSGFMYDPKVYGFSDLSKARPSYSLINHPTVPMSSASQCTCSRFIYIERARERRKEDGEEQVLKSCSRMCTVYCPSFVPCRLEGEDLGARVPRYRLLDYNGKNVIPLAKSPGKRPK